MRTFWLAMALSAMVARGQEFEVASVKAAAPGSRPVGVPLSGPIAEMMGFSGGPGSKDPGRIDYRAVSLKMLLVKAYQVRAEQISGPEWMATERYDIAAKVPLDTDAEGFRLMLQKLLAERFQISLHRETKELPVYFLTVAKKGPKFKPPEEAPVYKDDAERTAAMRAKTEAMMAERMRGGQRRPGHNFSLSGATTQRLAAMLSANVDRAVIDRTHIEGKYSFALEWDAENAHVEDPGPSIFTAVQEQLGLKLEPGKEQTELIVIDKVEKTPTSN